MLLFCRDDPQFKANAAQLATSISIGCPLKETKHGTINALHKTILNLRKTVETVNERSSLVVTSAKLFKNTLKCS